jgi:hypothetical protein
MGEWSHVKFLNNCLSNYICFKKNNRVHRKWTTHLKHLVEKANVCAQWHPENTVICLLIFMERLVPPPFADTKISSPLHKNLQNLHRTYSHSPLYSSTYLKSCLDDWQYLTMYTAVILYCLGTNDKSKKRNLYLFSTRTIFPKNIFDLWLVESMSVDFTDMKGWLYFLGTGFHLTF